MKIKRYIILFFWYLITTIYGWTEGGPFTAWGEKYVYFPLSYEGSESVGHAPRDPCKEKMSHWQK